MNKERLQKIVKNMVNFEKEVDYKADFDLEVFANEILDFGLNYMEFPYESEINLLITDSSNINIINKEFRGMDKPTDVLSFPMNDVVDFLDENYDWEVNPDTMNVILGDIVINSDYVVSQAKEYGHSEKREYAFLLIHSLLHLLGYDHIDKEDEKIMFKMQKDILNAYNIRR